MTTDDADETLSHNLVFPSCSGNLTKRMAAMTTRNTTLKPRTPSEIYWE